MTTSSSISAACSCNRVTSANRPRAASNSGRMWSHIGMIPFRRSGQDATRGGQHFKSPPAGNLVSTPSPHHLHKGYHTMSTRTAAGFLAAAVLAATATGCTSSTRSPHASTPAAHIATVPPTTVAVPPTTVANLFGTAADEVEMFRRLGLPVTHVVVYTAATDPNSLLGRPGQYLSAASWQDPRVRDRDPGYTDDGGRVEVFADPGRAQARAAYVQSFKTGGLLGTEYDYLNGPILVRISGVLTPAQAAAYGAASGGTLYQL